jgi:hypothetical protein
MHGTTVKKNTEISFKIKMSCLSLEAGTSSSNFLMFFVLQEQRTLFSSIKNQTNAYLCSKAFVYVKIPHN